MGVSIKSDVLLRVYAERRTLLADLTIWVWFAMRPSVAKQLALKGQSNALEKQP